MFYLQMLGMPIGAMWICGSYVKKGKMEKMAQNRVLFVDQE
jgi:hypothetical protein